MLKDKHVYHDFCVHRGQTHKTVPFFSRWRIGDALSSWGCSFIIQKTQLLTTLPALKRFKKKEYIVAAANDYIFRPYFILHTFFHDQSKVIDPTDPSLPRFYIVFIYILQLIPLMNLFSS